MSLEEDSHCQQTTVSVWIIHLLLEILRRFYKIAMTHGSYLSAILANLSLHKSITSESGSSRGGDNNNVTGSNNNNGIDGIDNNSGGGGGGGANGRSGTNVTFGNELHIVKYSLKHLNELPLVFPLMIDKSNGIGKNLYHQVYPANSEGPLNLDLNLGVDIANLDGSEIEKIKDSKGRFSIRLTSLLDASNLNFYFETMIRKVGPNSQIVIARFTNDNDPIISKIPENVKPIIFKSKVISRIHGCFKVDSQGNWFLHDHFSSSGTFLNNERLSLSKSISKDYPLKDKDIIQFGVTLNDSQGQIYRCVKLRVELNNSWKRNKIVPTRTQSIIKNSNLPYLQNEEICSICLNNIAIQQPVFISHCFHFWHFNCIMPIIQTTYPQFNCPNCRSFIDFLDAQNSSDSSSDEENEPLDQEFECDSI
ncbi:hypothetical protein Kpol_1072p55 [Vanderwaltozyma polyspora DSM 70294]|uniref:Uncharacterized protein n=1 Tax=Vanderwaltozyma polyspora (strain ATCC 22028 / DSM 70294 / BCRC 21397 / CBS 2163 / NBRC 10782 / NRRL Y-8283 / UCD 57-17) TaxID=436907 RepID=A7TKS3_VANPO|nr:uncharacterized protein Kpol_1072p55 [Vanderwaltozyma polyspora DSM 70294]EDO17185.1 hypothetical protein Kpol_1072p55 [Vanderwaltozyma polyspora DSM 70294]